MLTAESNVARFTTFPQMRNLFAHFMNSANEQTRNILASSIWIKTKQEVYIHCFLLLRYIYLCRFWGVDPIIHDIIKASVLRIVWRLAVTDYPISNCTIPISKGKGAKRYQHYLVQQMTEKGFKTGHCNNLKQCVFIHHEDQCQGPHFGIVKGPLTNYI